MNSQDIKNLPDSPGVYYFLDSKKRILYIGKATSLRDRVRSYFSNDIAVTRGPKIVGMLEECTDITFEKTDSVLEALLLEAHLIKKYQPKFNQLLKDGNPFIYLLFSTEGLNRIVLLNGASPLKLMRFVVVCKKKIIYSK